MDGPVHSASPEELDWGVFFYQDTPIRLYLSVTRIQPMTSTSCTFEYKKVHVGNKPLSNPHLAIHFRHNAILYYTILSYTILFITQVYIIIIWAILNSYTTHTYS